MLWVVKPCNSCTSARCGHMIYSPPKFGIVCTLKHKISIKPDRIRWTVIVYINKRSIFAIYIMLMWYILNLFLIFEWFFRYIIFFIPTSYLTMQNNFLGILIYLFIFSIIIKTRDASYYVIWNRTREDEQNVAINTFLSLKFSTKFH